jgi:hypothetical protein
MKKTLIATAAGAALLAGSFAPTPAKAAWWIAPAIVGGVAAAAMVGTAAAQASAPVYVVPAPRGTVRVRTASMQGCYLKKQRINGRLRTVEVCY